jgi:hypothetical protein
VKNGSETGVDCGGSCPACATTPCAGICTNPTSISVGYSNGYLGSSAACYQITSGTIGGWNCGNFTSSRTLSINGTSYPGCNGTKPVPAKRNGGYCFNITSGQYPYAYFGTWP